MEQVQILPNKSPNREASVKHIRVFIYLFFFSREKKYLEGLKQWWWLDSTSITEETAVFVQRRAVRV